MSDLPKYDERQIRAMEVLMHQSELMALGYATYSKGLKTLIEAHEQYKENPELKSRFYNFQSALVGLEAAKALIQEAKDDFLRTGLRDCLP
jgi:hypothetical protein